MIAEVILFVVAASQLFAAIAEVESGNGRTSDNVYQIQRVYLDDFWRIYGCNFADEVATDRHASEQVMLAYWEYYGEQYARRTGRQPKAEVLARIHNGGPNGWRKDSTLEYWRKVKAAIERMERRAS